MQNTIWVWKGEKKNDISVHTFCFGQNCCFQYFNNSQWFQGKVGKVENDTFCWKNYSLGEVKKWLLLTVFCGGFFGGRGVNKIPLRQARETTWKQGQKSQVHQYGPPLPKIYVSEGVFVSKAPEITTLGGGGTQFWGGGGEQETTPAGSRTPTWNKAQHDTCNNLVHLCPNRRFKGGFVNETPEMTTFWGGGGGSFGGWGQRAQLKGSHVSTCWNPDMSFSMQYGVTFRGVMFRTPRFGT